jgi:hypothetical protein
MAVTVMLLLWIRLSLASKHWLKKQSNFTTDQPPESQHTPRLLLLLCQ